MVVVSGEHTYLNDEETKKKKKQRERKNATHTDRLTHSPLPTALLQRVQSGKGAAAADPTRKEGGQG